MTPERWRKIQEIFEAAIELENSPDVASFLDAACAGDAGLRAE